MAPVYTPTTGAPPFVVPDALLGNAPTGGTMGMIDDAAAPFIKKPDDVAPQPGTGGTLGMVADAAAPFLKAQQPQPLADWKQHPAYQALPPQLQAVADGLHLNYAAKPPAAAPTDAQKLAASADALQASQATPVDQVDQTKLTDEQVRAARLEADAARAASNAQSAALEAGLKKQDELQADLDRTQDQRRQAAAKTQQTVDGLAKQAEDYKFDHGRYWANRSTGQQIGWLVAVALSGIGDAFNHVNRPNPVLQMLQDRIKADVDQQFTERDQLRQKAANAEHSLDRFNVLTKDLVAQKQAAMGQAQIATAKQMELAALKMADPKLRAEGLAKVAALRQAGYGALQQAGQQAFDNKIKQQAADNARAQVGLGYAQLKQSAKFHADELAEKQREFDLRLAEAADKARAAGNEKAAKEAEAQAKDGLYDARTARPLVQPEGRKMLDDADKLELQAQDEKDPSKRQAMQAEAATLRTEAAMRHGFRSPEAKELREVVSAGQTVVDVLAETRKAVEAGPSAFNRDGWADIKARLKAAKIRYAESLGVKPGPKEMEALDDIFGGDPSKMTDRMFNKGKIAAALSTLERDVVGATTTKLRSFGYRGDWAPSNSAGIERPTELRGVTGQEAEKLGTASPMTVSGLAKDDEAKVAQTVAAFRNAKSVDERERAMSQLRTWVAQPAAPNSAVPYDPRAAALLPLGAQEALYGSTEQRPGLSAGVLAAVRETGDLDLYRRLVGTLPADQRAMYLRELDAPRPVPIFDPFAPGKRR